MRTLEKNKVSLWYCNVVSIADEVDSDGYFTGEKIKTYGVPTNVRLPLYPFNGEIDSQIFGSDCSFDMVSVSNNLILTKDALLFTSLPTSNYDITYDYRVDNIKHSLNTYQYGLVRRT